MANVKDLEARQVFCDVPDLNVEWETDKAYLFVAKSNPEQKAWIAKTQCTLSKTGELAVRKDVLLQKFPGYVITEYVSVI
jgi:hypothetical protein